MKPFQAIRQKIEKTFNAQVRKAFDPLENIDLDKVVGWHKVGGSSAYGFYQANQYENGYSSIRVLAEAFLVIEQYTVDKNGNRVASNILDRLYTPNTDMSAVDFREALMVTTLVHDKVRLRVHHKNQNITADSITGFTFMEGFTESIVDGKRYYRLDNGLTLTDDEVITLKAVNPNNINGGFSPSRAAHRWTRLDDYIADYQKGFFENGAVPSGEMVITAKTPTEFNDIVDTLQAKHRGASKNNNITYTHRPIDQNGSPLNAQIEWIPFSSANKDLGLKDLFTQVNQKIDSAYGVPASIRAVNDQNTYASIRVDELVLVKYALAPKTMKIWNKFTHELNRITGGTGVAITYDLEIPQLADEEKVKAEATQIEATTVSTLTTGGYTLESAIEYVKTGDLTALKMNKPPEPEKPEVTSTDELKDTPSQPLDQFSKSLDEIKLKIDELKPKAKKEKKPKKLSEIDKELYEFHLKKIIMKYMKLQLDDAIANLPQAMKSKGFGDNTQSENKAFTSEMLALLLPMMKIYGNRTVNTGVNIIVKAGLSTENIQPFEFTPSQRKAYEKYIAKVGVGYSEQTAEQIRQVLGEGVLDGATRAEIESNLREAITGPENQYRVERLARTEVNLAEGKASVSAMENIQAQTGYTISKIWNTSGDNPCEFCQALDGTVIDVEENFVDKGDNIDGVDGGVYNNDFTATDTADAHPNCNCYTTYQVSEE